MTLATAARVAARFWSRADNGRAAVRMQPERVVLDVRSGVPPCSKPPVRIFLGTEPAHWRAERVFIWSIEQVRDPSRVYEIYLMKELAGFGWRRHLWLTGFTNYRFAIPHFAGRSGRAIYNDVDQVYLRDPAELFDTDMGGHGFLAIDAKDSSVMLIDCARMAEIWTLDAAQRGRKNSLLAKALAVPGLHGALAPEWNARDREYVRGRSRLLHYTVLHTQPWRPFPRRFVYQSNPIDDVWFDLERAADASGYQVFTAARPSAGYTALLARLRAARGRGDGPRATVRPAAAAPEARLRELITMTGARTILEYRWSGDDGAMGVAEMDLAADGEHIVTRYDPAVPSMATPPTEQFDGVACTGGLELLPDEDVPWVVEELFRYAGRFVYASVSAGAGAGILHDGTRSRRRPREPEWWFARFEAAAARHPHVHWRLVASWRTAMGRSETRVRSGGCWLGSAPRVWVLTDHKPGHTIQSVGLAQALGWPYETKALRFNALNLLSNGLLGAKRISLDRRRSAGLAPPWPDVVIATGRRTAPVARWIGKQSQGGTRLVQLGRKGGDVVGRFDVVITCGHFRFPRHPRRIETVVPLNPVTPARLAKAAARWPNLLDNRPRPRIVLVVGGTSLRHRLDRKTARRMAEEVRAVAQAAGGSVFAVTSRRTGAEATEALKAGLGGSASVHQWQPGRRANPYLGYLALADVLVVTGDSESMLAEAAATGKPMYIYPLPEQLLGPWLRLREWVVARATARPLNRRGTVRPQQGLEYLCAWFIAHGLVRPPRDLNALHHRMVERGIARFFGEPLQTGPRPALREVDAVAAKVRALLGITDPSRVPDEGHEAVPGDRCSATL
ncbi:MAG: ELM1/GtrOC1 family putative glycosyltransferase [Candidatus Binatia bacterium]